jgi:hypothetical protein
VLGVMLALFFSAASAHAQMPTPSVTVASDLFEQIEAAPGGVYQGEVLVSNRGEAEQEVRITIQEFSSKLGGVNNYSDPAGADRSSAGWISLPRNVVSVAAGAVEAVPFTVAVPAADTLSGTHWAALIVEPVHLAPMEVPDSSQPGVTVRTRMRYAVHVAVELPGGAPKVDLLNAELVDGVEGRFLALDVENAGTRVVRPNAWLELYDEAGADGGRYESTRPLLYPGNRSTLKVRLDEVDPGAYTGLLFLERGEEPLTGLRLSIELGPQMNVGATADAPAPSAGDRP